MFILASAMISRAREENLDQQHRRNPPVNGMPLLHILAVAEVQYQSIYIADGLINLQMVH